MTFARHITMCLLGLLIAGTTTAEPVEFMFEQNAVLPSPNPRITQKDLLNKKLSAALILSDGYSQATVTFATTTGELGIIDSLGATRSGGRAVLDDGELITITFDAPVIIDALYFAGVSASEHVSITDTRGKELGRVVHQSHEQDYIPEGGLWLEANQPIQVRSSRGSTIFFNGLKVTLAPEPG